MLELWQLQTWKYPFPFLGVHLWWLLQPLQLHHCMLLHVWIMQWNIWTLEHWALEKYCCWGSSHPLLFPFGRKKAIKVNAINVFFTHGAYFDWWIKHGNCGHRDFRAHNWRWCLPEIVGLKILTAALWCEYAGWWGSGWVFFFYIAVDVAYSRFMLHLQISGLQKQFWTLKMTFLVPYLKYAFSWLCLMDPEFWNWHLPPMLDVQRLLL